MDRYRSVCSMNSCLSAVWQVGRSASLGLAGGRLEGGGGDCRSGGGIINAIFLI